MFVKIYALAVCFASVLCITISLGVGFFDLVQLGYPKLTMTSYEVEGLHSNASFRRSGQYLHPMSRAAAMQPMLLNEGGAPAIAKGMAVEALSEKEITRLREQRMTQVIDNVRHDARRSLIQILVILLVSGPLFFIHWRLARKLAALSPG